MKNGIEKFGKNPRCWLEQEPGYFFLVMSEPNFLLNIQLLLHITSDCRTSNEDRLMASKTTVSFLLAAQQEKNDYPPWSPFRRELRLTEGQIPVYLMSLTLL